MSQPTEHPAGDVVSTPVPDKTACATSQSDDVITAADVESKSPCDQDHAEPMDEGTEEEDEEEEGMEEEGFVVNKALFFEAAQILLQYGRLVLVGPPRCGKSYFAHALLQFFRKKGYTPKFLMNFCDKCSRIMNKEKVGTRRIVLIDNTFDQLRFPDEMKQGLSSFVYSMQEVWDNGEWNSLFIVVLYPHLLADVDRLEGSAKDKLLGHPQVIVRMTQDPFDPDLPFTPTVDTLVPFLTRVLRDLEHTQVFSLLLAMTLQHMFTFSYKVEITQREMLRLGYGKRMGCHELDRMYIMLKDVIYHRTKGGFISREVYDACGLALGLNGMMITLLRVCDTKFMVEHVRLDEDAQPSQATLVIPKRRAELRKLAMARMHELLVKKGGAKTLSQHPSFSYPDVVQEFFHYCHQQKDFAQQFMTAVDKESGLPLLYWSLWAPASHLSCASLDFLGQSMVKDSDFSEMVLSCLVACIILSPCESSVVQSAKNVLSKISRFHFRQGASPLNVVLPFPDFPDLGTVENQAKVDDLKASIQSRLCYLGDPALCIPQHLLSLSMSEEAAVDLTMSTEHWYPILRLLTDTEKDEKDLLDDTVLHLASTTSDAELIRVIVKSGASLTATNKKGLTPPQVDQKKKKNQELKNRKPVQDSNSGKLMTAATEGDIEEVKVLLCLGASLQVQDDSKNTPLHVASSEGHAQIVSVMVSLKAGVDVPNSDKQTPLHVSCASGHLQVAKLLLDNGADVNAQDLYRSSPLHAVCRQGFSDLAALLTSHGANVNAKDKVDTTPLFLACQGGHTDIVELLLQRNAQVNATNTAEGLSALHAACQAREPVEVIHHLLNQGADVHLKDAQGRTSADLVHEMGLQGPVFEQILKHSSKN